MGALMNAIQARRDMERRNVAPWVCRHCRLVNWPDHMNGTLRSECHGCGKSRFPVRMEYIGGNA